MIMPLRLESRENYFKLPKNGHRKIRVQLLCNDSRLKGWDLWYVVCFTVFMVITDSDTR